MKGQMKVKKLNDTGLYISEMDWDNTYICKENPIGNFVMIIEPLSGFDGGIIYFDRMIQTNMGEMPLQDYLDIRALECGFDSYKELEEAGFSIEIPETSKEKENNHDC